MTKSERIDQINRSFEKLLKIVPDNKKDLMISLIERAAFMQASIEELERFINEHGYTEEYQNGANQSGKKKSSEAEIYLSIIQRYNQTIAVMSALIPESEEKKEAGGSLLGFVGDKPKVRARK